LLISKFCDWVWIYIFFKKRVFLAILFGKRLLDTSDKICFILFVFLIARIIFIGDSIILIIDFLVYKLLNFCRLFFQEINLFIFMAKVFSFLRNICCEALYFLFQLLYFIILVKLFIFYLPLKFFFFYLQLFFFLYKSLLFRIKLIFVCNKLILVCPKIRLVCLIFLSLFIKVCFV